MSETLERDDVIELLNALGSAEDKDALWAARSLHLKITKANLGWDELLVAVKSESNESEERKSILGEELEDEDGNEDSNEDGNEDDTLKPSNTSARVSSVGDTEMLTLIDKLLIRKGNSDDLQEELESYKLDISNGEFGPGDRNYIKDLYSRLTKKE